MSREILGKGETLSGSMDAGSDSPGARSVRGFNPPKQSRSQETLDRIAEAAMDLMEEEGVEGATIAAIVERAGASVGSFYARFDGKEDLVRYLQERVWREARLRWDKALAVEAWEGLSVERVVEGVVGLLLRSFQADFRRRRVFRMAGVSDPGVPRQVRDFHDHLLSTVTTLILDRREQVTHPNPPVAIGFGYRVVVGGIREILEWELDGENAGTGKNGRPEEAELRRELAKLWMAYLAPGTSPRSGEEPGPVDFFDPWG